MVDFNDIPEKDRGCLNCIYFGLQMDTGDEYKCGGIRPCSNYSRVNEVNYFVPDDRYLQDEYGCDACKNYEGGEFAEECVTCSCYYSNRWERQ